MNEIQIPAGLRVLESIVDIVNNRSEIGKVIASIHKARDEANDAIKLVGTVKQIEKLRIKAEKDAGDASVVLLKANRKADVILGKAGEDAANEKARQARANSILQAEESRGTALDKREKLVGARETELQDYMDETKALRKEADTLMHQAGELNSKATEQMAMFKRFAATVNH